MSESTTVKWKHYRIYPLYEAIFIGIGVFFAIFITTYFIYHYSINAQKEEIKEGLLRTARIVSSFIDKDQHSRFINPEQQLSPMYANAIQPLESALKADDSIEYLYTAILKDDKVYFILDATPKGDNDNDGIEDKANIMDVYPEASKEMLEALRTKSPVVADEPYTDRWGSFISGYIPLLNANDELVGVLGIDIKAKNYFLRLEPIKRATTRAMVLGFFIAFLVASLVWFTRKFGLVINNKRKELFDQFDVTNKK
jgi:hypothetical protein